MATPRFLDHPAALCANCGRPGLWITQQWQAAPMGTTALAGNQLKVSATTVYAWSCSTCGAYGAIHGFTDTDWDALNAASAPEAPNPNAAEPKPGELP